MTNFNRVCSSGNIMATLHPDPPAKPPCWKCHDEGFVKVSKEDFHEYLEARFGVWLGENIEGAKNFIKQFMEFKDEKLSYKRMLPCKECSSGD